MNNFKPKYLKEAGKYLEWKLEQTKKRYEKVSFLKRILKKFFS